MIRLLPRRDVLFHDLNQNISPAILIYKIYWTATETQNNVDGSPKIGLRSQVHRTPHSTGFHLQAAQE